MPMLNKSFTTAMIAEVAHEANRAYCRSLGDFTHLAWSETREDVQQSAINGVQFALDNPEATPESMHANWREFKEKDGWTYGPKKDLERKQHPNIAPYGDLPATERAKDFLFLGVVRAFQNAG